MNRSEAKQRAGYAPTDTPGAPARSAYTNDKYGTAAYSLALQKWTIYSYLLTGGIGITDGGQLVQAVDGICARLGVSIECAREHTSYPHRCVDGRTYRASCLVADPSCHDVAAAYLAAP